MDDSKRLSLDTETWSNQELYEVISSRYFILGNESSKMGSWEVKGANGRNSSEALLLLNNHLKSLGMIGTLSEHSIPILTIRALPPSGETLKKWQQLSIWSLMSLFLTIVGSEWLGRYDPNKNILSMNTMQESLIYFTLPVIFSLLFASVLRSFIASKSNLKTGLMIPIIFPILYPVWPFGLAGLISQKRIDFIPFPNRKRLAIIESIVPVMIIFMGLIFTMIGLMLTSNEPPEITKSPIVFTSSILSQFISSIFIGDIVELRLQWLHPIGISGIGLSMIGWILLLPIPGFPGDRIVYSLLGQSKMESGSQQTTLFIGSLIFMIIIFASVDYLPWLFLSAFAAWQRFSPENVVGPFVVDHNDTLSQDFKSKSTIAFVLILILGFPGITPLSNLESYDSGLSTENWDEDIYFINYENITINIPLEPDGILPVSGFLQFSLEGSNSDLWEITSDCSSGDEICIFNNITQNTEKYVQIFLTMPEIIMEEKIYLKIVIDVIDNEKEHLIEISNKNYSGPSQVFWELVEDSDTPLICTKINILAGDFGNLSTNNSYWKFINSTIPDEGINDLCLRGYEGAIMSSNRVDQQFRKYGPSIEFKMANNSTLNWDMPIENTNPKIMISGTEWQIPEWFNSNDSEYSIMYGPNNPSFCKSMDSINEVGSNWSWLIEAYSPIKFKQGEVINGTLIMPSSGWLILCDGPEIISKYTLSEGLDIIIKNSSIGEKITNSNFTISNRESKNMSISIEWHGDSINTEIWDVDIPSQVNSNDTVQISINEKSNDLLHRAVWVKVDDNGITIHLAARCPLQGCST